MPKYKGYKIAGRYVNSLKEFSWNLKRRMVETGHNNKSLAHALGTSPGTVSAWVNGNGFVRGPKMLAKLCLELKIEPHVLTSDMRYRKIEPRYHEIYRDRWKKDQFVV